jgi:hypothetical protein
VGGRATPGLVGPIFFVFCLLAANDKSTWDSRFLEGPVPVLGPLGRVIKASRDALHAAAVT